MRTNRVFALQNGVVRRQARLLGAPLKFYLIAHFMRGAYRKFTQNQLKPKRLFRPPFQRWLSTSSGALRVAAPAAQAVQIKTNFLTFLRRQVMNKLLNRGKNLEFPHILHILILSVEN